LHHADLGYDLQMIIVAHPNKPFEYTPKNTPRRKNVLAAYEQEIEDAYAAFEESSQMDFPGPEVWTAEECMTYAQRVVHAVLGDKIGEEDDIFLFGCDR
jgi:hypothetical protein